MTNQTQKLYWTADSPYCRIVLWSMAESAPTRAFELVHLNWDELRNPRSGGILSEERTVPCLSDNRSRTADSLRILATLNPEGFTRWLTSADGALYRCAEGQLGRVMYALYDGFSEEKTREAWSKAQSSAGSLLAGVWSATSAESLGAGLMAAHTFFNFCLHFRPEWLQDISDETRNILARLECSASFANLRSRVESQSCRVPCGLFSGSSSAGAER
jgi:hypothetical protein